VRGFVITCDGEDSMFEVISDAFGGLFQKLKRHGKLTERNVREGMRDVRTALLEADVNFRVVKDFMNRVTEECLGERVLKSVTPAQQVIKIVHDTLAEFMGPVDMSVPWASEGPTVFMLCGLQGSGKTTTCAKLAVTMAKRGKKPMMVAADIQRPAAIEQLITLGRQIDAPVYSMDGLAPPAICEMALQEARLSDRDVVILDTAGRLHIDDMLMAELEEVAKRATPHQILLVADAMTGQDAVNSAQEFDKRLPLDGVILTKLDGDARGGAALSIKHVTGKPIKYVGVGEKLDRLEEFRPEGMADRILGRGDVVEFVNRAQSVIDEEEAEKLREKMKKNAFTLTDFMGQIDKVRKMGPLKEVLGLIPGLGSKMKSMDFDETELVRTRAIIQSMTPREREHPESVDASRRNRVARGSGVKTTDVSELLKQFKMVKSMMRTVDFDAIGSDGAMQVPSGAGAGAGSPYGKKRSKRKKGRRKKR